MNIWFKTSRSGVSNITSTSRTRQDEQMLPTITEQRINFEEAEDDSNSSDRVRQPFNWQNISQSSSFRFDNKRHKKNTGFEDIYVPSSRNNKEKLENNQNYYNRD